MSIIKMSNVTFTYAGATRPSLVDITLEVGLGEFVVITGPSGCGKTTICRCLNGLIPNFYSGEMVGDIVVDGLNVRECTTSELSKHVGLVFQNPENQLFSLSIERDIAFGPENLGLPRDEIRSRVEWALGATGITDLRGFAPYELSGGQQQRAAISAVLAMKPKVVALDEPTSFLDPKSATEIIKVIAELNREHGVTIVLIEHRLDLVCRYADRVVVMNKGRIALNGTPREVLGEEAHLIGVGLPKVSMLFHLLRKDGVELELVPVTVEEAAEELRRRLTS